MLVLHVKMGELGLALSLAPHGSLACVAERVEWRRQVHAWGRQLILLSDGPLQGDRLGWASLAVVDVVPVAFAVRGCVLHGASSSVAEWLGR